MAKRKRGQGASAKQQSRDADDFNPADSKLKIKNYEDVADSEDDFHLGRDEVLLDKARGGKRRRQMEDDMMELSDEEVLADGGDDDDDEEVPLDEEDEANEEDGDGDDLAGYGASRADYYGADVAETEQDALEEEEEARRIQQENLKRMKVADFGFDEGGWLGTGEEEEREDRDDDKTVTEVLPPLQITEEMGPAERLKLLKQRYREFEFTVNEFVELQKRHTELGEAAAEAQKESGDALVLEVLQYRALSGYLGALAMYFALLTSTASDDAVSALPLSPQELQNHPVFTSIHKCRETWEKVKDLQTLSSSSSDDEEMDGTTVLDEPELDGISETALVPKKAKKKAPRSTADPTTTASLARRAARLARTEASLADLTFSLANATNTKRPSNVALNTRSADDADSDLGDTPSLLPHEAAEKARRRKSLRFYTSQLAQKANKRANAGRVAGGDEDLPYRERFRDRQERLNREAEARGKKGRDVAGAELGGDDDDEEGEGLTNREKEEMMRDDDGEGEGDASEAAMLARIARKKTSKAKRDAAYTEAAAQGGRVVRVSNEDASADGKRAVGYTIEKNKGLMPRRKKDVKNPRVKKRKKFEEKTKKLASMKPVFKGGEGRGGYGGQLTGIKSNLVRSVKF